MVENSRKLSIAGFTLVEMLMAIIVISLCAGSLAVFFEQASQGSYKTRVLTIASALAEEKMEETISLGFSSVSDSGPAAFSSPFNEYTAQVVVHYAQANNLDVSVDPVVTAYKTVEVLVDHSAIEAISLKSLLTNY